MRSVSLCTDCEYPLAGDTTSLDELPRCWRPPFEPWLPKGPATHFRECDVCDSLWAVRIEADGIQLRLLPPETVELFDAAAPVSHFFAAFEPCDDLTRRALSDLFYARLDEADRQGHAGRDLNELLRWMESPEHDHAEKREGLRFLGHVLASVRTDPHLEEAKQRSPGLKRELFEARIDRGHGLAEAAQLAQRDWVSSNSVVSLPTVRGVDLSGLVELHDTLDRADPFARELSTTLSVFAVATLRPPVRLTATSESKQALTRFLPE
ncbi:MAG: hypothetical protein AAFQ82_06320 [Myxococcota bacterium]